MTEITEKQMKAKHVGTKPGKKSKARAKKDPNAPKAALSPYMLFC